MSKSEIKRYAIVRGLGVSAEKVAAYLPSNYRVIWEGRTDWHLDQFRVWKQVPEMYDKVVVIEGRDDHGWTLDKHVAPRLGSGMMRCDECDLSHPIMKEIPDSRTLKCHLCGTEEREDRVVEAGWLPSYWNCELGLAKGPVCLECSKKLQRNEEYDDYELRVEKNTPSEPEQLTPYF